MSVVDEIKNFAGGAVRSKDAESTRYDLLTPIGLDGLATFYASANPNLDRSVEEHLGSALASIYTFLGGKSDGPEAIIDAASDVAEAIAAECGELRDWVLLTPRIDDCNEEGYPYERIPVSFLKVVAETSAEGAEKYGDFNWEKGMPCHDILNHAIRHILLYLSRDRSEPHLAHSGWNLLSAIHSFVLWPELNAPHLRGPDCDPPAPEVKYIVKDGVSYGRFVENGVSAKPKSCFPGSGSGFRINWNPTCQPDGLWGKSALYDAFPYWLSSLKPSSFILPCEADEKPKPAEVIQEPQRKIPVLDHFLFTGQKPPVLYLSGPMSNIPELNFPAFHDAANKLRKLGYPVLNPADFGADPALTWADCLKRDLLMLAHAQVLVRLPGWEHSKGASLEHNNAVALGLGVVSLSELLPPS